MRKKYDESKKITLNEAQDLSKDILKAFHSFCVKHGLVYYIMFGTLLGAVRDGDIIPWDHDIDTIMLRDEYNKLLSLEKIFYEETGYKIINFTNQKHMPVCFSRIINEDYCVTFAHSDKSYINDSLYIDIFVLDKGPSSNEKMKVYYKKFAFWRWILSMKYNFYEPTFLYSIVKTFFRAIFKPFSCKMICEKLIKKAEPLNKTESENVFVIDDYFRKRQVHERYLISDFGNPKTIKFGDFMVYAPNNSERILLNRYGNYLELPPKEKRICLASFFKR